MPENQTTSDKNDKLIFLFIAATVFIRPMVSGMGLDVFGSRAVADVFLRIAPLALLVYAVIRKVEISVPAWIGLVVFIVAAVISSQTGLNPFHSFERVLTLTGGFALMICVGTWAREGDRRAELIQVMLVAGGLVALYGIYQYFWGFDRTIDEIISSGSGGPLDAGHARDVLEQKRIFSTTFSPDMLAGFLALMVPVALGSFRQFKETGLRLLSGATLILCAAALYMTGSLGGWLAAGAGVAAYFAATQKNKRNIAIALGTTAVCVAILSAGILIRRGDTILDLEHQQNPIVQRLFYWEGGLKVAAEHPFLGVGPGNFGIAYVAQKRAAAGKTIYAHSHWIQALAETGPAGFAGLLWIGACFVIGGWRLSRGNNGDGQSPDYLEAGIFAGGMAFIAHGFIDYDLQVPEVAGYFWVLAGLSASGTLTIPGAKSYGARATVFFAASGLVIMNILWLPGAAFLQNGRAALEKEDKMANWYLTRAIEWRPGDPEVYSERAKAHIDGVSKFKLVLKDLNKAIALSDADPFLWAELGQFLYRRKDFNGALEAFGQARARFPTYPAFKGWEHLARAKIFMGKKQFSEAREELYALLKDFPGHPAAEQGMLEIQQLENPPEK